MEDGAMLIMLGLVILAVIYALVSGTGERTVRREGGERVETLAGFLEEEMENEHRKQAARAASTLTDLFVIAMLVIIIAVILSGMTGTAAM